MNKTEKELAILRDLFITPDWTLRFTELFDKNFKFADDKEILYVNPGTGNHVLGLLEKLEADSRIAAYSEDVQANILGQGKADIVEAEVAFLNEFPRETFDLVIADASFVQPDELSEFLGDITDLSDKRVAFLLPTAGSFGEIFSFLWESFLNADLLDNAAEIERMINTIPTISAVEEMAANLGLSKIKTVTESEIFEFENGPDFIDSPLVADFLLPVWLDFIDEDEQERVRVTLAKLIDDNAENLTFQFTVKATFVTGEK
ncbi:MAG: hypothetical protein WKF92_16590 [Pyrinomonadaceae bacterium]